MRFAIVADDLADKVVSNSGKTGSLKGFGVGKATFSVKNIGLQSDRHCPSLILVSPESPSDSLAIASHHRALGFAPGFGFTASLTLLDSPSDSLAIASHHRALGFAPGFGFTANLTLLDSWQTYLVYY